MHPDLRRLDLNLLLVFDALYRQRSVTAAADELALSASACSHALARLRDTLGDTLFVRYGNEMQPTTRADEMARSVRIALDALSDGLHRLRASRFEPEQAEREFTFAATDYTAFAVMPAFLARMQRVAPNLRFRIVSSPRRVPLDDLADGRIDFALGYTEDEPGRVPATVVALDWLTDAYVVIASAQRSGIGKRLTMAQYLAAKHVVVTPWNEARGSIDRILDTLGVARDVAVHLPSVLAAPFIVAASPLIMTVPRRAALLLQRAAPVRIFTPPFAIPPYTIKIFCHAKHAQAEAHQWVQAQLIDTARTLEPGHAVDFDRARPS
jgi:DNA-binding transcriptional LysR family regulator